MSASRILANYCSGLRYDHIPGVVIERTLELMLDWTGSCLAGSGSRQAQVFRQFAAEMGPDVGASSVVGSGQRTSPYFAAMINASASHVVEQDDLHNSSVFHPGTVVFPPVLAMAEREGSSGEEVLTAVVAGYEAGIRIGEFLGQRHYRIFHTTATAGTLAAAMAVANLLKLAPDQTLNALGSAGTQAAGLWEFLGDAADSKQLHTAKAAADGLLAAVSAARGLTGASRILEGDKGLGAGLGASGSVEQLTAGLGDRWALAETSFKFHASCRHTHPAADALLAIMQRDEPALDQISRIDVDVYQAAKDVLGAVSKPTTIHQSKFSMGFVLALIASYGRAGVTEFTDAAISDPALLQLHDLVSMTVDDDIDSRYPVDWCARVTVTLRDGVRLTEFVDTPRGDPGNALSRAELEDKAHRLVAHYKATSAARLDELISCIWSMPAMENISTLFKQDEPS